MASKQYRQAVREIDRAARDGRPLLSTHAVERYDRRVPADAVAPERALREAVPDEGIVHHPWFDRADKPTLDRVHVYIDDQTGGVVFLEVEDCIVTTWAIADCKHRPVAAYLRERWRQGAAP